jgi:RTX calcium-binding nonapeptide repeat (4 copies)
MRAALLTAVTASLVFALAALAAGIVGTDRGETLRGTARDDRISGRGGNDVLIGYGGRDVVDGGRGADRLSLRDGERDTAICGPGRDVVLADSADVVLGDCEDLRVVPPEPTAPPPRPVVPGPYGGRTTQGQLVTFEVSSGGELSRLALPAIDLTCSPPAGPLASWSHDFGATTTVVHRDGRFTIEESGTRALESGVATYRIAVSGLLTVGIATGSVQLAVELTAAATTSTCIAPNLRWTAAAAVLTGP